MRVTSPVRTLASGAALAILLAMSPQSAFAQCSVSGPDQICGSGELCGPAWATSFRWTGPNGFAATTQCVTITEPGTYNLRAFDGDNGLWFNCSKTVTAGVVVPNTITGPTSACSGSSASLCGPTGSFEYAWSGPNFSSTAACVDVVEPGTYRLVVHDPVSGCSSPPDSITVAFERCGPPPPPPSLSNCPRPACFWSRQCSMREGQRFSDDQLDAIAHCVDDRAASLSWDASTGLCRALSPREWNLRNRATRQFAAVMANVCAGGLQLAPERGPAVGLDPATVLSLDNYSGTLADWIAATDAALVSLKPQPLRQASVSNAYRQIIRAGWNINHGRGMGAICPKPSTSPLSASSIEATDDFLGDESLTSALQDDTDAPLTVERMGPSVLAANTVIAFIVNSQSTEEVSIAVYDISGRMVRQLVRGTMPAGRHDTQWDGRDESGQPVRNGMYFVLGRIGSHRSDTRITVIR